NRNTGLLQPLVRAGGGQQLDTETVQALREFDDATFVGHAQQGAADPGGFGVGNGGSVRTHQDVSLPSKRIHSSRSYCFSFLRSVPRLRPSICAARLWLLRAFCITASSSGASTSLSTMSYRPLIN